MKILLVLQARVNSKRYKAKIFKEFGSQTLVEYIQKRFLLLTNYIDHFVLAIPYNESKYFEDKIINPFKIIEGPEYNLLQRFYIAFSKYNPDIIIRATSDNPYFSIFHIKQGLKLYKKFKYDYLYAKNLPLGTQVEIIKREAFIKCYKESFKNYHFEHVTPYIYENPDLFNILKIDYPEYSEIKDLRLTFDEKKDYILLKKIGEITNYSLNVDLKTIKEIYTKNKKLFEINKNVKQKSYFEVEKDEDSIYHRIW